MTAPAASPRRHRARGQARAGKPARGVSRRWVDADADGPDYVSQMAGQPPRRAGVNVDEVVALGGHPAAIEVGQDIADAVPRFTH